MGSLKDEMRGVGEDLKPCEKAGDGERPGGSDDGAEPEPEPQINISQESTVGGDCEGGLHKNASSPEEREENRLSKDEELSGGSRDNVDQSDITGDEGSAQTVTVPLMLQPETTEPTPSANTDDRIPNGSLSDGERDKNMDGVRGKGPEMENISVPLPRTPGPSDPCSPAPAGQHHMRTQVSLEVIQCQSAATSPMMPDEGGHSFLFPSNLGRCRDAVADGEDAEPQAVQRVEFCSVATSPMTPKTPHTTAFPELVAREVVPRAEKVRESEGQRKRNHGGDSEFAESSINFPAAEAPHSGATVKNGNQQRLQQKMGSMDQDITIMVTHYSNNEEEEESTLYPTEAETVKIDEVEDLGGSNSEVRRKDGRGTISRETAAPHISTAPPPGDRAEDGSVSKTGVEGEDSREGLRDVSSMKPRIPESPAPFGCHHVRTQVSLEVVQCQSAATSPMTPPEGDQAFSFPSSSGTSGGTKDAELQMVQQGEFRSVATAPMTPRTPTATTFPEIMQEKQDEWKEEEEEIKKAQVAEEKQEGVEEINVASTKEDRKELEEEDKVGDVKEEVNESEEKKEASIEKDRKELEEEDKEGDVKEEVNESEEKKEASIEEDRKELEEEDKVGDVKEEVNESEEKKEASIEEDRKELEEEDKEGDVKEEVNESEEKKEASIEEDRKELEEEDKEGDVKEEVIECEEKKEASIKEDRKKLEEEDKEGDVKEEVNESEEKKEASIKEDRKELEEEDKEGDVREEVNESEEKKEASIEEDRRELEEEDEKGEVNEEVNESEEDRKEGRNCKEKGEEPVQEVSWDEKGMTWEVYGAVVEVTVLGSAIQKHLEKRVKKRQPSMPPPPPLDPSAVPLSPETVQGGSTKGRAGKRRERDGEVSRRRRNPFRLMMENMQQPHCCSKAHTTE